MADSNVAFVTNCLMLQGNSLQDVQTKVVVVEPKADVDPIVVATVRRVITASRAIRHIAGGLYTNL